MTREAVLVKNISKKLKSDGKEFYALKNVSFSIKEGEIFGLLGPNGAGKTTLINILTTLLIPDEGTAFVCGYNILKDRYELLEVINAVSGETKFHWLLSVKDILKFYSVVYNLEESKRREMLDFVIEKFEIKHLLDKKFYHLSTGERMRVVLAKSLLNLPKVLFLDEPTVGLDPDIAIKTRKLIRELNKELKITILLTSHYMFEVEQLCKRIAFINKGQISDIGTIKKIKRKRFSTYEVVLEVAEMKHPEFLRKHGFRLDGKCLSKTLNEGEDISEIIRFLVESGYDIVSIESKHPTLEDYFLKMTRGRV